MNAEAEDYDEYEGEQDQEQEQDQSKRESILKGPNEKLLKKCRKVYEDVRKLREKRKEINAEITAALSDLEAEGISKKAVKHVWSYLELEDEQRRMYDLSASLVRVAQGLPVQGDLFTDAQVQATQIELVK